MNDVSLAYVIIGDDDDWVKSQYRLVSKISPDFMNELAADIAGACLLIFKDDITMKYLDELLSTYHIKVDIAGSVDVPLSLIVRQPMPYAVPEIALVIFNPPDSERIFKNEPRYMSTALAILNTRSSEVKKAVSEIAI
jgi:hypothetical protein